MEIKVKKLSENAVIPSYGSENAACFDLYAAEDKLVLPSQPNATVVKTDLVIEIPKGFELQIRNRSGLTTKSPLEVWLGTGDADYRGNYGVMVKNANLPRPQSGRMVYNLNGRAEFLSGAEIGKLMKEYGDFKEVPYGTIIIHKGDRIAQAKVERVEQAEFVVVEEVSETERGEGGFGHTGV